MASDSEVEAVLHLESEEEALQALAAPTAAEALQELASPPALPTAADQSGMILNLGPSCLCEPPLHAQQRLVGKEGPNKGRLFWSCVQCSADRCDFFAWATADDQLLPDGPRCGCEQPSVQRVVVKVGPTQGRRFSTCAAKVQGDPDSGCRFFLWDNEPLPVEGPPCFCSAITYVDLVRTPGENLGRPYARCLKLKSCGYFTWYDEEFADAQCSCNLSVCLQKVKPGSSSVGRYFLSCAARKCGYFSWHMSRSTGAAASSSARSTPY